jgi:hypothetical protein
VSICIHKLRAATQLRTQFSVEKRCQRPSTTKLSEIQLGIKSDRLLTDVFRRHFPLLSSTTPFACSRQIFCLFPRFMLRSTGLEVTFSDGSSVFFNFPGDTCKSASAPVTQAYRKICTNIAALPVSRLWMRFLRCKRVQFYSSGLSISGLGDSLVRFELT